MIIRDLAAIQKSLKEKVDKFVGAECPKEVPYLTDDEILVAVFTYGDDFIAKLCCDMDKELFDQINKDLMDTFGHKLIDAFTNKKLRGIFTGALDTFMKKAKDFDGSIIK